MNFKAKLRMALLPVNDLITGHKVHMFRNLLTRSQTWSAERINDYQNKKLKKLIRHAYCTVPYYNKLFNSIGILPSDIQTKEDLVKIPILTKEDIRSNFPDMMVSKMYKSKKKDLMLQASSGSTGEPLQYYTTKTAYSMNFATNIRGWECSGWKFGENYVKVSNWPRHEILKKLYDIVYGCTYIYEDGPDDKKSIEIIKKIRDSKCKMIYGYPSTISVFAEYMKNNGKIKTDVRVINTHGEILFPHLKDLIESQFGCRVFDGYSGEGGANASQCESRLNYHLSDEYAITELVETPDLDSDLKKRYEVVSTDLWNYAVPFIRYNIKDISVSGDKECVCGRKSSTLRYIEGRDTDILRTPHGKSLIVQFFTGYFEWVNTVDQFQVVQDSEDSIVLKIIPSRNFTDKDLNTIRKDIQDYIGSDMNLKIELVDEIPLSSSGKRRFVVRNFQ